MRDDVDIRLNALNELGVLDTPPEERFDDIVLLATQICLCPVALISFVTHERQWFKARIGFSGCETPLSQSVCQFVLTEPDILVIPDLRLDERTKSNTLVTDDPKIRFYAGAPILNHNNVAIGSLCVIDTVPRPEGLTEQQQMGLRTLARQVMTQLEFLRIFTVQSRFKDAAHETTTSKLMDERRTGELREEFVAVLGHDLRNPLNAIAGGLQIVEFEQLSDRGKSVLSMMKQSAARMEELIENTLDLARTKFGDGISVDKAHMPLKPVLQQVIDELHAVWPERKIRSELDFDSMIPCDTSRIAQLFSNLLSNALKHGSKTRPIHVKAGVANDVFSLSVSNGGTAISPEILEVIFQPYARGNTPDKRGLGLGLYIASEIAKAHNGTINVTSSCEETRFVFQMPIVINLKLNAA